MFCQWRLAGIVRALLGIGPAPVSTRRLATMNKAKLFEWLGVATAIAYSLLVASNTGFEFIGFTLLLASSLVIAILAWLGKHRGILFLQFFYAVAGIIGMVRWYNHA